MPHILWIYLITAEYILLTIKLVALKREHSETTLTVKRTGWSKSIDYFGRIIEADSSREGKTYLYFVHIGYIPRPSSVNIHISRHHLEKQFNLQPQNLCLYQPEKIFLPRLLHIFPLRDIHTGNTLFLFL